MPKCPRCLNRKGKRSCPALGVEICPQCCAEGRLHTIACPRDCPHLAGEIYQHRRRKEHAFSHGRAFIEWNTKAFPAEASRELAFRLQADIYYFSREHGPVEDEALASALDGLKGHLSKIFVPPSAPHPILAFLVDRLGDERRYPLGPGFGAEERAQAIWRLASEVRALAKRARAPAGGSSRCRHNELISSFFDSLDFEADLDYSPQDSKGAAAGDGAPVERRTASGLILPS